VVREVVLLWPGRRLYSIWSWTLPAWPAGLIVQLIGSARDWEAAEPLRRSGWTSR
jgi:hypothetical protein